MSTPFHVMVECKCLIFPDQKRKLIKPCRLSSPARSFKENVGCLIASILAHPYFIINLLGGRNKRIVKS